MKTAWIFVVNPKGITVEVSEDRWPELSKKGYLKASEVVSTFNPTPIQSETADLNYVCTLWASNGLGRMGEETLLMLDKLGLKINVIPHILEKDGLKQRTLQLIDKKYFASPVTLIAGIPELLERYHTERTYLYTAWDTTKVPDLYETLINQYCTKVYVISDFIKDILHVNVPVKTINCGVDNNDFPYVRRNWTGTFRFITSGDISVRKGTDVLIRAFEKAFPKEKDVELIIKSNHPLEWGKIFVPDDPRIKVMVDRLSPLDYRKLLSKCHCFVFPSRSEGFGLPPLEAMSTGMPAIIHGVMGLGMYANDKYDYPIKSDGDITPPEWHYPAEYSTGGGIGKWLNPDEESLTQLMKYVYTRREEAKDKGKAAADWVKEKWGWDKPIMSLWEDIVGTKFQDWGEFYANSTLTVNNVQDCINSHKELFYVIRGFYPDSIQEAGTGPGEMSTFLSWKEQKILGKEINKHYPTNIQALDIDTNVLAIAKRNFDSLGAGKIKLVNTDIFKYKQKADLIFSQGTLEHFTDKQLKELVNHELKYAPVLVHSVPNDAYGKRDYGNERLLTDEQYYEIFKDQDLTVYRYWKSDNKKIQTILVFQRKEREKPKVSIIMLCYNHKDMTIKAIECVRKHTKNYELIVIDNGSTDGIGEWLDEQKDIRVVHSADNMGVPGAKNLGMAIAKGEYICFLDNDTEAGEDWLETLLTPFKDKQVGFVAHEGYIIDREAHDFVGPKITVNGQIEWASGSVFLFPKRLLRKTGLLIDRDSWCAEDVDFCCKIRRLGYIGMVPSVPVKIKHLVSVTARNFPLWSNVDRFRELLEIVWKENGDVIQDREIHPVGHLAQLKVGYKFTHHHVHGGGEKACFTMAKQLSEIFPRFEMTSGTWEIQPDELGVNMGIIKRQDSAHYDLYFNYSHFELPEPKGDKNVACIFYPQYDWKEKLNAYDAIITISKFCQSEIKRKWNRDSYVVYPSINVEDFHIGKKKKQIVSIGRFFQVEDGNNKNQNVLIEAFKKMPPNYKLIFVGTVQNEEYFNQIKEMAKGYDIEFRSQVNYEEMTNLLAESEFLWHAAGYGATDPAGYEHFGIVAVEALASGCRTLVYNAGGIIEITGVETWNTPNELISLSTHPGNKTPEELRELSKLFSYENSKTKLIDIINKILK